MSFCSIPQCSTGGLRALHILFKGPCRGPQYGCVWVQDLCSEVHDQDVSCKFIRIFLNPLGCFKYFVIFLVPLCMAILITFAQDFTVPSLKFETGSGYARQTVEQFDDQNEGLDGYQIDETRAWDLT